MKRLYHHPILSPLPEHEWQTRIAEGLGRGDSSSVLDAIIPLLNGMHSTEQVLGKLLLAGFEPGAIFAVFDQLEQHQLIEEAPDSEASFLSVTEVERYKVQMQLLASCRLIAETSDETAWQRAGGSVQVSLKKAHVVLVDMGTVGSNLAYALALAGVGNLRGVQSDKGNAATLQAGGRFDSTTQQETMQRLNPFVEFAEIEQMEHLLSALGKVQTNLLIYCPDAFDEALAKRLNESCLRHSIPFLIYQQKALEVELGPLVIPHETACYVCYELRRRATLSGADLFNRPSDLSHARLNFPLGVDWLAVEAIKFLTDVAEPITRGRIWRLNFLSGLPEVHPVLKLPRCSACGIHQIRPSRKLWEE